MKRVVPVEIGQEPYSFEDALIKSILNGDADTRVCEEAILTGAVLESLTPAIRALSTENGRQIGRSLFKHTHASNMSRTDDLRALYTFLKSVGYANSTITDSVTAVSVKIYRSCNADMGGRIHHFEAGLISGFVGSSFGIPINAVEVECANNGGKCCIFEIGMSNRPKGKADANLYDYINMIGNVELGECTFLQRYQILSEMPLLGVADKSTMKAILSYIGACTAIARFRRVNAKSTASKLAEVARTATALGFGSVSYRSNPRTVTSTLSDAAARIDFANLSGNFIDGMASKTAKCRWAQSMVIRGGIYKVSIKDSGTNRRKK